MIFLSGSLDCCLSPSQRRMHTGMSFGQKLFFSNQVSSDAGCFLFSPTYPAMFDCLFLSCCRFSLSLCPVNILILFTVVSLSFTLTFSLTFTHFIPLLLCLFDWLAVSLSVSLSLYVCLSLCLSISLHLSVCLSLSLPVCLSPSLCLSISV